MNNHGLAQGKIMSKKKARPTVAPVDPSPTAAVEPIEMSLPAKMLRVGQCASFECGRLPTASVLVERSKGTLTTVATDGRVLILARTPSSSDDHAVSVLVPRYVAKRAAELAKSNRKVSDVVLRRDSAGEWSIEVADLYGSVRLGFTPVEGAFPPYMDVIPNYAKSRGISVMFANPRLVEEVIKGVRAVVPDADLLSLYIPESARVPFGLQAVSGAVSVVAVVMPLDGSGAPPQVVAGTLSLVRASDKVA